MVDSLSIRPASAVVRGKSSAWEETIETVCYELRTSLVIQVQMMPAGQMGQVDRQTAQQLSEARLRHAHALLGQHRPGHTPLRYDLILPQGCAGQLDVNGTQSVRVEADLPSALRSLPGVRTVLSGYTGGTTPDRRAHTVFDRTLLRAGETVSMKHFVRDEVAAGLALPAPDTLPGHWAQFAVLPGRVVAVPGGLS